MDFRKEPVPAFVALDVIARFHLQMDKIVLKDRKKKNSSNKLFTIMTLMLVQLVGKNLLLHWGKKNSSRRVSFLFVTTHLV